MERGAAPDGDDYTFEHALPPPPYHPRAYPAGPDVRTADQKVAGQFADLQTALRLLVGEVAALRLEVQRLLQQPAQGAPAALAELREKFGPHFDAIPDVDAWVAARRRGEPEGGADGDGDAGA